MRRFREALLLLGIAACTSGIGSEDWSDDGELVFHQSVRSPGEGDPRIFRIEPPGYTATPYPGIAAGFAYSPFPHARRPNAAFALFTVQHDIVGLDIRTGSHRRLASSPAREWYPRPSPDGAWVLFESDRHSFRDLYKVRLLGGPPVRLTNNPEGNFDGAWSPDGQSIAFASSRHGQLDLFVMKADGSEPRRLTRHPGDSVKPAFSASGTWIAFLSARDGQDDLYVIRPDGSRLTRLTPAPPNAPGAAPRVERFAWHPQKHRIAYSARAPGKRSAIFVIDVPRGEPRRLSPRDADDREPAWSPTGHFVAFSSSGEIYVARPNGTRRTQVTRTTGRAWLPRWLPQKPPRPSGDFVK